jgi:hypothetical protein
VKGYANGGLVELYAQAQDMEAANVLKAMAEAAAQMARLEGMGAFDVRQIITDAAGVVVTARRNGMSLDVAARQMDIEQDPLVGDVVAFFARNIRSARKIAAGLKRLAQTAYNEAKRPDTDMFGAAPAKLSRAQLIQQLNEVEDGQGNTASLEQQSGPESVWQDAGRGGTDRAGQANGQSAETGRAAEGTNGQTEEARPALELTRQTEAQAREAERQREEADNGLTREQIDREREAFTLSGQSQPKPQGVVQDMFTPDVAASQGNERLTSEAANKGKGRNVKQGGVTLEDAGKRWTAASREERRDILNRADLPTATKTFGASATWAKLNAKAKEEIRTAIAEERGQSTEEYDSMPGMESRNAAQGNSDTAETPNALAANEREPASIRLSPERAAQTIAPVRLTLEGWTGSVTELKNLAMAEYAKLQGQRFRNNDMNVEVLFNAEGGREAFRTSGNARTGWKAEMVKVLPELVQRAVKVGETLPDARRTRDTRMFHTLVAPLAVNGRVYTTKITLREALPKDTGTRHKFYDITTLEIDNGPNVPGTQREPHGLRGNQNSPLPAPSEPSPVSVGDLVSAIKGNSQTREKASGKEESASTSPRRKAGDRKTSKSNANEENAQAIAKDVAAGLRRGRGIDMAFRQMAEQGGIDEATRARVLEILREQGEFLSPADSLKLKEAHRAAGRNVTRGQVEYMIAERRKTLETGKEGGYKLRPKALQKRREELARLEEDLALFDLPRTRREAGDSKPAYSFSAPHADAETVAGLRSALERVLGRKAAERMIRDGVIVLHATPASLPDGLARGVSQAGKASGLYDPATNTIHLIAAYTHRGEGTAKAGHEGWHMFLNALGHQDSKAHRTMMNRLAFVARSSREDIGQWFDRGLDRIQEREKRAIVNARTPAQRQKAIENYLNELAAYAIEEYERAPRSLPQAVAKWVQDFIASIRAALMDYGFEPKNLTAADLSAISRRFLRQQANQEGVQTFPEGNALASVEDYQKGLAVIRDVELDEKAIQAALKEYSHWALSKFDEKFVRQEFEEEASEQGTVDGRRIPSDDLERDEDGDFTEESLEEFMARQDAMIDAAVQDAMAGRKADDLNGIDNSDNPSYAHKAAMAYLEAAGIPYQESGGGWNGQSYYLNIERKNAPEVESEEEEVTLKLRFANHENQTRSLDHTGTEWQWVTERRGETFADMMKLATAYANGETGIGEGVNYSVDQDERPSFYEAERAYGGREAYNRAREAGRTKLNYRQWVQVRTPEFKAWFGNWEALAARTALDDMKALPISNPDLAGLEGKDLRDKVWEAYKTFREEPVTTQDGREVQFTRVGFNEVKNHSADRNVMELLAKAREVLPKAVPLWSEAHTPKDEYDSIMAWHYYGAKVSLGGTEYLARIVVRENENGDVYYDNDLSSVEKIGSLAKATHDKHGALAVSTDTRSIGQWYAKINPASVSKVTDPSTGEPRVVYHATSDEFTVFDLEKLGRNTGWNTGNDSVMIHHARTGFWFHESPLSKRIAYRYDMPVFLNLRNISNTSWDSLWNKAKKRSGQGIRNGYIRDGKDGLIVNDTEFKGISYVAFRPSQVKSATDNTGAFSEANDDIRYSVDGASSWYRSELAETVPGMAKIADKQGRVGLIQARAWLAARQKEGKFKQEELEWSGLTEWLNILNKRGEGKIHVADIESFLKLVGENSILVEDVTGEGEYKKYSTKGGKNYQEILLTLPYYNKTAEEVERASKIKEKKMQYREERARLMVQRDEIRAQINSIREKAFKEAQRIDRDRDEKTISAVFEWKFSNALIEYSLKYDLQMDEIEPETRKEFANKIRAEGVSVYDIRDYLADWKAHIGKPGFASDIYDLESNFDHLGFKIDDLGKNIANEISNLNAKIPGHSNGHWEEKDVLAHVRLSDFEDSEGKKTLFVEEIQSDWAQDKRNGKGVPDAPFIKNTKDWTALSIKRIAALAVEGGHKVVAFINGKQSADRYKLSKHVSRLKLRRNSYGIRLVGFDRQGEDIFSRGIENEAELADYAGKELANKLWSDLHSSGKDSVEVSGIDMDVGGEGMKAFYDQIVPNVARTVLKKIGGKGLIEVDIPNVGTQVGFEVTDEMILQAERGLPLFSVDREDDFSLTGERFPVRRKRSAGKDPALDPERLERAAKADQRREAFEAGKREEDRPRREARRAFVEANQATWQTVEGHEVLRINDSNFVAVPVTGKRNSRKFAIVDLNDRSDYVTSLNKDEVQAWLFRQAEAAAEEARPALELTRQTPQEARQAARRKTDDLTKEQIDREREAFTLSGQSQPKPQGVAQDLFTADGRPTVAAQRGADQKINEKIAQNAQNSPKYDAESQNKEEAGQAWEKASRSERQDILNRSSLPTATKTFGASATWAKLNSDAKAEIARVLGQQAKTTQAKPERPAFELSSTPTQGALFSVDGSNRPILADNDTNMAFTLLAQFDDAFQQPTPKSKSIHAIAREVDKGYTAVQLPKTHAVPKGASKAWVITAPSGSQAYVYEHRGEVWIDISRFQSGKDQGNKVYGIAAGYAHNNGKVFIGDPLGLTRTGFYWRLENMISSALRYGTTDHIRPHPVQLDPETEYGEEEFKGLGLKWKDGDTSGNLTNMMELAYNIAVKNHPKIKDIIYDFDRQSFVDTKTSRAVLREGLKDYVSELPGRKTSRYIGGSATAARAVLFNTFLQGQGRTGRPSPLAAFGGQLSRGRVDKELKKILYSVDPEPTGHAQPLSAKVLTPTGFRLMGDIHVGDEVIAADGSATKVTHVFPQGRKPIYRVVLDDGSATQTTSDHLWHVREDWEEGWKTIPLAEILAGMGAGKVYELPRARKFA